MSLKARQTNRDPRGFLKELQAGRNGNKSGAGATHTWKLNEEGSKLKIYNVKYLGKAVPTEKLKVVAKAKVTKAVAKAKKKAA